MIKLRSFPITTLVLAQLVCFPLHAEEVVSFNDEVKPILSDRCFKCHGPDAENQRSDFRLDTQEHALEDLGGYFGVVPGDPEASEVHLRIHATDPSEVMPPPKSNLKLTAEEKRILEAWIKQGATYEKHWSFVELPDEVDVPESVTRSDWVRNEIDQFVAAGFDLHEMEPAAESPRGKWLRRVSFDLTGLPPTLEELDAFEADRSEDAYEKVVDRLLATDFYAERMTAEWLDVARYSDSYGYQRDDLRHVWPWRDWVLQAFRDNLSYDRFITEQIAGDLLPEATEDQKLATAFNRLHGHCMEGGSVLEEYRCEYVADRVETFGTAFLGLTMNCTRCHDHKYDPLTAEDFYSLGAFFSNIDEAGLIAYFTEAAPTPAMPIPNEAQREALEQAEKGLAVAEKRLERALTVAKADFDNWLKAADHELEVAKGREVWLDFESVDENGVLTNRANPEAAGETKPENQPVDEGKVGKAIRVTGDDVLEVKSVGAYERDQPWSASVWIRPSEIVARANVLSRGKGADDSAGMGYELLLLDGKPTASLAHFYPGDAIRIQAKEAIQPNEWTHLGVTYDGSSRAEGLRLYVNGVLAESTIVKNSLTRTISTFRNLKADEKLGLVLGQRYREAGLRNGLIDEFQFWSRAISPMEMAKASGAKYPDKTTEALEAHFLESVSETLQVARADLQAARQKRDAAMDAIPAVSVMREFEEPRRNFILERGAYDQRGAEVTANTPAFLPPMDDAMPRNRLGLAQWLTSPNHPLVARVAVNRYWQLIFGEGLVSTPEDFGNQGALPTHPRLLDWLSRDFIENGWDVKHLLRQMVLSATYRQSTETSPEMRQKDPENRYLARSHATRLPAEMIRDNALAVSGLLVDKWGGPTVKPYQIEASFKPTPADEGEGLYRRSVYTWWKRNAAAPVLTTFGVPKRDVCTVKREFTATPIQSLILLNDPQFVEAARVFAAYLCEEHGDNAKPLVTEAYRSLTSRLPEVPELAILTNLYTKQRSRFESDPESAAKLLQVGDKPIEGNLPPASHAAATVLVNAIMNLDDCLTER